MATKEKTLTLDDMIKSGILKYGNDPTLDIEVVPIGIPALDEILGGGFPRRRNTLIVGDYSSGKTFLAQQVIRQVQKAGGLAAYIDVERSYDREWFRASGINVDELLVPQPEYGERAIDIAIALLEASVDCIVLDSIGALVPMAEEEASAEQQTIGLHPRLVTKAYKKITVANKNSIFIAINQRTKAIGPYPVDVFPGGKKQSDLSHIILKVNREQWITEGDKKKKVGFDIHIEAIKNKLTRPWGECTLPFYFSGEIDETVTNIDLGLLKGIITVAGPYYQYGEVKKLGKTALRTWFKENPDEYGSLVKRVGE